jgi:hypothetical protein
VWPTGAALLLLALLHTIRLLWARYGTVFGGDAVSRLLSAGVVALIFSETLGKLIFDIATVLSSLFSRIPTALAARWHAGEGLAPTCFASSHDTLVSQCLQPAIADMLSTADTYLALPQLMNSLDFGTLVFALAVWALLGQILSSSAKTEDNATPRWKALVGTVSVNSRAGWSNFWLAVTIGSGAMPAASAHGTVKGTKGGGGTLSTDSQSKYSMAESQSQLQSTLDMYAKNSADEATAFSDDTRTSLLRQIDDTKATAHQLIAKQNLVLTNARSKAGYIVDVKAWVERSRESIFERATSCHTAVDDFKQSFANTVDQLRRNVDSPQAAIYSPLANHTDYFSNYRQYCVAFLGGLTAPEAASLPVLGAFSFATWLIKLGSIALTLVAGMLGFGLLGAAISSIIREGKARQPGEPLVKDLTSVAIRGMSATVVVYLAAKGGLAIIAGGAAPEPNSYVLLLTCFVASVFGDDVWVSTRKWFQGREFAAPNATPVNSPPQAGATGSTQSTSTGQADETIQGQTLADSAQAEQSTKGGED